MLKDFGILMIIIMVLVVGSFYYYGKKLNNTPMVQVDSFEECAAAGYPVMESYPEQCRTPDGRLFVREVNEPIFCTADAFECPDGSYVGRTGPNCEFICPSGGN